MQVWKTIPQFSKYSASSDGQIRNDKTGRILKQHKATSGYMSLDLGQRNPQYVHRLVASAFLDNPDNLPQVDHIDGNKINNNVENLRWVSVSQNCWNFGYAERIENRKKKVVAVHLNGRILHFDSRNDAAEHFQCSKGLIHYEKLYVKGRKKGWTFYLDGAHFQQRINSCRTG